MSELEKREMEAHLKAESFIKRLQLYHRLGAMWFLEEEELEVLRSQAL